MSDLNFGKGMPPSLLKLHKFQEQAYPSMSLREHASNQQPTGTLKALSTCAMQHAQKEDLLQLK